ncbi:hypothetical protein [Sphingomonas sp.]|uniref:hypothetical protein n=1 Tax=Sphingomonas sp. TaxID=28214 RepID=UPI001ED64987|nr:hypothetical protein [Sphingomonas sp.]MBX3592964.1 hypothetical protein [Sphingomonas sp.]
MTPEPTASLPVTRFTPSSAPESPSPVQTELTPAITAAPGAGIQAPGWLWPLLGALGLLVVGGGAGWLLGRRRRAAEADAAPDPQPVATSAPSPGPPPLARPAPAASPPRAPAAQVAAPPGPLVTELRPLRAAIRDGMVVLDFELFIQNRGPESADNIRATLTLFGANPQQDAQIEAFQAAARMAPGSEPFSIAAGNVHMLNGQVSLPADQMQAVMMQGKQMFVPIVPVALRWYAGLSIKTLRDAFMIGTAPAQGGDRLGPLWVERAGEGFGRLAAKRYATKVPSA